MGKCLKLKDPDTVKWSHSLIFALVLKWKGQIVQKIWSKSFFSMILRLFCFSNKHNCSALLRFSWIFLNELVENTRIAYFALILFLFSRNIIFESTLECEIRSLNITFYSLVKSSIIWIPYLGSYTRNVNYI